MSYIRCGSKERIKSNLKKNARKFDYHHHQLNEQ